MSILDNIKRTRVEFVSVPKIAMTEEQVASVYADLKDQNRLNVYVNKYDIAKPFRVAVKFNEKFTNHGVFSSADVASAVGSIVSAYMFGPKALVGSFDQAAVEGSEEFQAWMANSKNAQIVKQVNGRA
tara:strand:- start:310 stop:693 length:384 start_codon:yes stop_codon:yes gene_type:complete